MKQKYLHIEKQNSFNINFRIVHLTVATVSLSVIAGGGELTYKVTRVAMEQGASRIRT